jgi:FKBP-type peptidyl-prolyl cis-trans isomerase SlyD
MTTKIIKDMIVSLAYEVRDTDGALVDQGAEPLVYIHGGYDALFPKLEAALDGKGIGAEVKVRLEPQDAFGDYDAELVVLERLDSLPPGIQVGAQLEGAPDGDEERAIVYTVTEVAEGQAVLDGNHPLAGMALDFSCTVKEIRAATEDEIEAASATHH